MTPDELRAAMLDTVRLASYEGTPEWDTADRLAALAQQYAAARLDAAAQALLADHGTAVWVALRDLADKEAGRG